MKKNVIRLSGISSMFAFSHSSYGEKFYGFYLMTARYSGTYDVIRCYIPESLNVQTYENSRIEVVGEIRTRRTGAEPKTETYVFVREISLNLENDNCAELSGTICRIGELRKTLSGRTLCDITLAVPRGHNNNVDYIPLILWGRNALRISRIAVGTDIKVFGRLQSREYIKALEDNEMVGRTAYELSVKALEITEGA